VDGFEGMEGNGPSSAPRLRRRTASPWPRRISWRRDRVSLECMESMPVGPAISITPTRARPGFNSIWPGSMCLAPKSPTCGGSIRDARRRGPHARVAWPDARPAAKPGPQQGLRGKRISPLTPDAGGRRGARTLAGRECLRHVIAPETPVRRVELPRFDDLPSLSASWAAGERLRQKAMPD